MVVYDQGVISKSKDDGFKRFINKLRKIKLIIIRIKFKITKINN